ncbi:MAG: hypothetical protein ACQESL_10005 [Bacteroidota bacterium]
MRPPRFNASEKDISKAIRKQFDLAGPLDFQADGRIVIGDRNFKIAKGKRIPRFSQGDYVGLKLNDAGEVVEAQRLQQPPRR